MILLLTPFSGPVLAQDEEPAETAAAVASGWPAEWTTSLTTVDDGATVIAGTADGLLLREAAVVTANVDSLANAETLYTHPAAVWKVVADQKHICSADYRGNLAVMNRESGEVVKHDAALERWCRALAIAPDGMSLVAGNETGKLFVWSFEQSQMTQTAEIDTDQIYEISFAPAGDQLVVADGGGHLHILKWPELTELRKIELGTEPIWSATYAADGAAIFAGGAERKLWRIDLAEGSVPGVLGQTTDWITSIVRTSTGDTVFAATMDGNVASAAAGGAVSTGDAEIARLEPSAKLPSGVWAVTMPGDNHLLAATRKHAVGKLGRAWQIEYAEEPGLASPDKTDSKSN